MKILEIFVEWIIFVGIQQWGMPNLAKFPVIGKLLQGASTQIAISGLLAILFAEFFTIQRKDSSS